MDSNTEIFLKWGMDLRTAQKSVIDSDEPIVRFFGWHDMHPVSASIVLTKAFDHDWVIWEPETLKAEIIREFKAPSVSTHNWNKIQAARTMLNSDLFWNDWATFEKVIQAFNNNVPRFDILQVCTVAQLMAGVDIANTIKKGEFGDDVKSYTAVCAVENGIPAVTAPLVYAERALAAPMYRCLDCGNVDTDDLDDGKCDVCSQRYTKVHNLDRKAAPYLPPDTGTNIKRFLKRDPRPVLSLFSKIKDLPHFEANPDSDVDVPAAKLAVAYKYMLFRRQQLAEQAKEISSWL